jgi:hypothetical protein
MVYNKEMLMLRRILLAGMVTVVSCAMLMITGCEDNDAPPTGTSIIRGEVTIDSFTVAPAVLQGILVQLTGPVSAETVSDENGLFVFTGLPAGDYVIIFYVNGEALEYPTSVAEGQEVILYHVKFNEDGSITVFEDVVDAEEPPVVVPPAVVNIAGDWTFSRDYVIPAGKAEQHLEIAQDGSAIDGTLYYEAVFDGNVDGDNVTMNFTSAPFTTYADWTAVGTINGDATEMSGTWSDEGSNEGTWTATKGWDAPPIDI